MIQIRRLYTDENNVSFYIPPYHKDIIAERLTNDNEYKWKIKNTKHKFRHLNELVKWCEDNLVELYKADFN